MIEVSESGISHSGPAELTPIRFPQLHCRVAHGDTIRADLLVAMPAAIVSQKRLYYFEVAATSDSTAHAIAGALSESRIDAAWQVHGVPFNTEWEKFEVGERVTIRDSRLEVPHFKGRLHHVAVLDASGELLLADNDNTLWEKLRSHMSCPTLKLWGDAVMPTIHRSGLLLATQSFGMGDLNAYILAPDASQKFDDIISAHVRTLAGLKRSTSMKEAA